MITWCHRHFILTNVKRRQIKWECVSFVMLLSFIVSSIGKGLSSVFETSIIASDKGGGKCVCSRLSVCLSVSKITQKRVHGFGWWNVACRQTSGHGQTDYPDPDYSPDAGIGLLSPLSYKRWYAEFYVRKIRHIRIGRCSDAWFYNGFIHWASEPSKHFCRRYMRSTECPSS